MECRDKTVEINENEFVIVPKGVIHRPVAIEEVSVMLFEPKTILNTGDTRNNFTKKICRKYSTNETTRVSIKVYGNILL